MSPTPRHHTLLLRSRAGCFGAVLYVRAHTSKADDAELPAGRTLFAANVPHACSEEMLRAAFESLGVHARGPPCSTRTSNRDNGFHLQRFRKPCFLYSRTTSPPWMSEVLQMGNCRRFTSRTWGNFVSDKLPSLSVRTPPVSLVGGGGGLYIPYGGGES